MRNLRKDQGGYALLYVMVVIILLCAVAMMICTVAMRNLQSQQASVERMVEKYEAQGEIEKILAQAERVDTLTGAGTLVDAEAAYTRETGLTLTQSNPATGSNNHYYYNSTVTCENNEQTVKVTAELDIDLQINLDADDPNTTTTNEAKYTIVSVNTVLASYTIENGGGE